MLRFKFHPYTLNFSFKARTSRGSIRELKIILIEVSTNDSENIGWGEICVLPGLSIDESLDYTTIPADILNKLESIKLQSEEQILEDVSELVPATMPSLRMGMETALLDLLNGGRKEIFTGDFYSGNIQIPINGLIWMGHSEDMLKQVNEKIYEGFDCIKIKIGGIDFDVECDILDYIRRRYFKNDITLRLDANGSMSPKGALNQLHRLAQYNIHSIEQPLNAGMDEMANLIKESPIPIALDEELIGLEGIDERKTLLDTLKPSFLVLKPSLLGGFRSVAIWIKLAEDRGIGWWITSSLESNVGLNAIAQFVGRYKNTLPQGLGTGKLYENNFESALRIKKAQLLFDQDKEWMIRDYLDGKRNDEY